MKCTWTDNRVVLRAGLAAALMAAASGCGGPATETDSAVVTPTKPSAASTSKPAAPAASGAPTSAATEAPAPAASAAPVKAEGFGTLKGQVVFAGDPPPSKVLFEKGKAAKDPDVCAKDAPLLSEALVVDSGSKGVKNVLVYITKPTAVSDDAKKAAASANVVFDQSKCIFEPHVLGLMAGVPITIKSSDPVQHNVDSKLKNNGFNNILAAGAKQPYTPTAAERMPGEVICDIHSWMRAWWMVFDHPYFAVTDAKGNFEIKNVPAGTQKIVVWQESLDKNGFLTAPSGEDILIKANDTVSHEFKLEPSRLRAQ
ncbi:hypothetical protein [Aquisphaera insulae]|uniref:hypothetical protein n=1 Tax=Aquisphaera insulae TaxID=2712864 RepID=UPI0013EAB87F|nr:hypothetical protein [Aquisphaera insulae]